MKIVKLNRLTLENFKCHRFLNLEFGGGNVSIYGDNASGKTSIYDALTWLLFGKDSVGNGEKNMEIKPLDMDGNVIDHNAITSVEAEFLVDGESVVLRRTFREVWSTRRGSSQEVFDGNTSEYFADGVPMKKYAYDQKIREIVDEDTFRMLTSASCFAADLKWQSRRNVLFDMAGTLTDREIMTRDERFAPLLDAMDKLSVEDFRRKVSAQRKGLLGVKDETPARLNECQKAIQSLSALDFDAARTAMEGLQEQEQDLSARLIALENNSALEQQRLIIREARLELDGLEAENKAFRASQANLVPDTIATRREIAALEKRKASAAILIESLEASVTTQEAAIEASRERWISINGEVFAGESCPTCGQRLPFEQLRAAREAFEAQKMQRLREIERTAESQMARKSEALQRIQALREEIAGYTAGQASLEEELRKAEESSIVVADMDGYAQRKQAAMDKIAALNRQLTAMLEDTAGEKRNLRSELDLVRVRLEENRKIVSQEGMLNHFRQRMEQIRKDAAEAAASLESLEKMLYLLDEYIRFKTGFVEGSVNSLFRIARFRLYREQANGGTEDRCDVVYDGVPYLGLNNGAKINVGIDIINALSRHYGVTVPLFVDNAESVTRLEESSAQVIRLVVSESDKELRLEHEN